MKNHPSLTIAMRTALLCKQSLTLLEYFQFLQRSAFNWPFWKIFHYFNPSLNLVNAGFLLYPASNRHGKSV
jgi:hypothetical protein